jgi:hypothetical protein
LTSCKRELNIVGAAIRKPHVAFLALIRNSEKMSIARTKIARRGVGADE